MTIKDQIYYAKKRLFNKSNAIFMTIISIIILIIFSTITIMNMVIDYIHTDYKEGSGLALTVYGNDLEKLESYEHVSYAVPRKYASSSYRDFIDFDKDYVSGTLEIKPLIASDVLKLIDGKYPASENEMICSKKFYPYSLYLNDEYHTMKVYKDLFVDSKSLIGKTYNIKSYNEDFLDEEMTFEIVGTYKNKSLESASTCYILIDDYDKITSKYAGIKKYEDINHNEVVEYLEYSGYYLKVDKKSNVDKVINTLEKDGYNVEKYSSYDESLYYLFTIPLVVCLITLIVCLNSIVLYCKKKFYNNVRNINLLNALGYSEKEIINLQFVESLIIIITSSFISFVIMLICFKIIENKYLSEFIYNNYFVPIPLILLLFSALLLILFILFITKKIVKTYFNKALDWSII